MHKGNWITLVLDGSVEEETVRFLLDRSHSLTAQGAGTKPPAGGRTWLIPANPKYYDVEAAFAAQDTIRWKQSSRVAVGDTIYLYVAAPVSSILYQCKAVEVDIPFRRTGGPVKLERVMEIQRLHQFRPTSSPWTSSAATGWMPSGALERAGAFAGGDPLPPPAGREGGALT